MRNTFNFKRGDDSWLGRTETPTLLRPGWESSHSSQLSESYSRRLGWKHIKIKAIAWILITGMSEFQTEVRKCWQMTGLPSLWSNLKSHTLRNFGLMFTICDQFSTCFKKDVTFFFDKFQFLQNTLHGNCRTTGFQWHFEVSWFMKTQRFVLTGSLLCIWCCWSQDFDS